MTSDDCLATLNEPAASIATQLLANVPGAELISGRRSIASQAAKMAANVLKAGRSWISETYMPSPVRDACQAWVDAQTSPLALAAVTSGLTVVLANFSPTDLSRLSWHLDGNAFDADAPNRPALLAQAQLLVQGHILAGGDPHSRLLTNEGGVAVCHVQAR